jgi:pimeloyl-ACP methyl ester carboxylesterase
MASRVLASAPPRFTLGGLSMGGYVAMEIMRQAPDRVEKLILADTSARPDTAEQAQRRQGLIELARKGRFKGVTPRLLPSLLAPSHLGDPDITGTIMAMAERVGREAYIRQQSAIIGRIDSRPSLKHIFCPVLIIVGKQDVLSPPEIAEEIASLVQNPNLAIVEDCGHLAPLEQPKIVSRLMASFIDIKSTI